MKKSRQIIITGLSIILATGAAVSVYLYKMDQQEEARQNELILDEGIALYNQTKYPEALQILETIEPGTIEDWRLPFYQGAVSVRLKDYQSAATYLEQARSLKGDETQVLYLLGVVYFKLGNLKLSEGYFAATLELDPTHDEARGLMGVMADLQKIQPPPDQTQKAVPKEQP